MDVNYLTLEYGEGVVVRRFIFTMKHIISNTLMEIYNNYTNVISL